MHLVVLTLYSFTNAESKKIFFRKSDLLLNMDFLLLMHNLFCFSINVPLWVVKRVPDSKVHGANMGPIWGRQDPGGPHVDPMNFALWGVRLCIVYEYDVMLSQSVKKDSILYPIIYKLWGCILSLYYNNKFQVYAGKVTHIC